MKVIRAKGDGQGTCKRCTERGKFNRIWMRFLYKIEGYEGCYCEDCVREIQATEGSNELEKMDGGKE